jgi:SAM-dependent methyltransferase
MSESIAWDHVARFYDIYAQATFDIPFFLQEAKKSSGEILELMAGTGRVSLPLIQAGVQLTCVDNSAEMLAGLQDKLEQQHLSARIHKMDVRELALHKQFDQIIIPFHSFSELHSPADQKQVLVRIYEHLSEKGRFICTLHNPPQRLRPVDGQLRLVGNYPDVEHQGNLLLWSLSTYDASTRIVDALQFYEQYDSSGVLRKKSLLQIKFMLLPKQDFEVLAVTAGFKVLALYGDYSYAPFQDETSPYMIWILGK